MTLSKDYSSAYWEGAATFWLGWALTVLGQQEHGITQMLAGMETWQALGLEQARTWLLALLAEAYGKIGKREEALALLAEALTIADRTGERFYEAELYRLKGELLLGEARKRGKAKGKIKEASEAEACFEKAIEVARQQSAKSWELRVAMSLSRLWHQQGKGKEARQLLTEIYGWFTEGLETADLQEAKALLAELA